MRSIMFTAFYLAATISTAYAGQVGGTGGAFVSGQSNQAPGAHVATGSTVYGSGNANSQSASGTEFNLNASGGSRLTFQSSGHAASSVATTPFHVTTSSTHDASTSVFTH